MSIVTSELRSSTPVRSARLRSASARALPARSSRLTSFSSSTGPGRQRQLGADAHERLVEAETGFDADDEQVEGVGQRGWIRAARFAIRASAMPSRIAEQPRPPSADHDVWLDQDRRRQQHEGAMRQR